MHIFPLIIAPFQENCSPVKQWEQPGAEAEKIHLFGGYQGMHLLCGPGSQCSRLSAATGHKGKTHLKCPFEQGALYFSAGKSC
jgi:hypothetical protein